MEFFKIVKLFRNHLHVFFLLQVNSTYTCICIFVIQYSFFYTSAYPREVNIYSKLLNALSNLVIMNSVVGGGVEKTLRYDTEVEIKYTETQRNQSMKMDTCELMFRM